MFFMSKFARISIANSDTMHSFLIALVNFLYVNFPFADFLRSQRNMEFSPLSYLILLLFSEFSYFCSTRFTGKTIYLVKSVNRVGLIFRNMMS